MEKGTVKQRIQQGLTVLVTALLVFSGSEYLEEDMLEAVFVCTSNERLYECTGNPAHLEPLSATAKSCYYVNDLGEGKYKRCTNGIFMPIVDYAEAQGKDPSELVKGTMNENEPTQKQAGQGITSENCVPAGCTPN